MIGRIVRSADFERVLRTPSRARSSHFAVHYLACNPSQPAKPISRVMESELSTDDVPTQKLAVDCLNSTPVPAKPSSCWLGAVVPKRHARRSVTRVLLKRQIRQLVNLQAIPHLTLPQGRHVLAPGLWVVRLHAPFDRERFPSAASDALRKAAGAELAKVLADASRRVGA